MGGTKLGKNGKTYILSKKLEKTKKFHIATEKSKQLAIKQH